MTWVKLDDQLHGHPKINRLWRKEPIALALHLMALSYCGCYLTDGVVPVDFVEQRLPEPADFDRVTDALVVAAVWERHDEGFVIHDYLDFNQSRDEIEGERDRKRAAGRIGAQKTNAMRWGKPAPDAGLSAGAEAGADGNRVAPVPIPVPEVTTEVQEGSSLSLSLAQSLRQRKIADTSNQASPEAKHLCRVLYDLVIDNGTPKTRIKPKKWPDAARLMLTRDKRDPVEAERLIRWCQQDDFWRATILSMPKFRERYDQVRLQAERQKTKLTSVPAVTDPDTFLAQINPSA